jgi:hypothetical protein
VRLRKSPIGYAGRLPSVAARTTADAKHQVAISKLNSSGLFACRWLRAPDTRCPRNRALPRAVQGHLRRAYPVPLARAPRRVERRTQALAEGESAATPPGRVEAFVAADPQRGTRDGPVRRTLQREDSSLRSDRAESTRMPPRRLGTTAPATSSRNSRGSKRRCVVRVRGMLARVWLQLNPTLGARVLNTDRRAGSEFFDTVDQRSSERVRWPRDPFRRAGHPTLPDSPALCGATGPESLRAPTRAPLAQPVRRDES